MAEPVEKFVEVQEEEDKSVETEEVEENEVVEDMLVDARRWGTEMSACTGGPQVPAPAGTGPPK